MKISVIIPAYNAEGVIKNALDSILAQTCKVEYEIIVVNDGSTDGTKAIVESYIEEHHNTKIVLINQNNKGVATARNTGMKAATGDWIAFLDSDDEWLPTKIQKQVDCINSRSDIDLIGTNIVGEETVILFRKKKGLSRIALWEQFIKWHPHTPTYLFRTSILSNTGYFNEDFRYAEDGEFLLRILQNNSCWLLAEPLVLCGRLKPTFGHSGLSGNLKGMQRGQRHIFRMAYNNGMIRLIPYIAVSAYSEVKYLRRIILTFFRKNLISRNV